MRYLFVLLLLLVITACTSETVPDATRTDIAPVVSPSVTETDSIDTETPVPELTVTPAPLMTPGERIQCPDAPEIQLIIQERGRVVDNNDTLNLRTGPGTSFEILVALNPRDQFTVIEGPTCSGGFSWFRIRYGDKIGWIAEGDNEDYYVEPYLSG